MGIQLNYTAAPMTPLASITWFGHSTFVIVTPGGKRIVTDPWLEGNPKCPPGARIDKADVDPAVARALATTPATS